MLAHHYAMGRDSFGVGRNVISAVGWGNCGVGVDESVVSPHFLTYLGAAEADHAVAAVSYASFAVVAAVFAVVNGVGCAWRYGGGAWERWLLR